MLKDLFAQIFQALPKHVQAWISQHARLFTLLGFFLSFIFGGIICQGIGQGITFGLWTTIIWPWIVGSSSVPGWLIVALSTGSILAVLTVVVLWALYVVNRRWADERDAQRRDKESCQKELGELDVKLAQLNVEIDQLNLRLRVTDAYSFDVISLTDRELFFLIDKETIDKDDPKGFYGTAYSRLATLFRASGASTGVNHQFRASIYTRDPEAPDYLVIAPWSHHVGTDSVEVNRWYIGTASPKKLKIKAHRGTIGHVFMTGKSLRSTDVLNDPEWKRWFHNIWGPRRDPKDLPYRSILQVPICPLSNSHEKYGVFSLDSMTYVFSERDQYIVEQIAMRFGYLMRKLAIQDKVIGGDKP